MRLAGCLLLLCVTGCAQRTLTINSEPQGALVWLNDMEVGRTPLTMDFSDYGNYDVVLRKEGYETLKTAKAINPPLYMIPPFDLFVELIPGVRDRQQWTFPLKAATTQPTDVAALLRRGEGLRQELQSSEYTKPASRPATRSTTRSSTRPATKPG